MIETRKSLDLVVSSITMLQLGTFINLFIILTISGGITGDERKKGYFDLLFTQFSVLVLSTFFSQFLKGQSNVITVLFFVLLGSLTVKYWIGSGPFVQLLKSLIAMDKGTVIYHLLIGGQTAGIHFLLAILGLVMFLLVFLGGGAILFEKLEH